MSAHECRIGGVSKAGAWHQIVIIITAFLNRGLLGFKNVDFETNTHLSYQQFKSLP